MIDDGKMSFWWMKAEERIPSLVVCGSDAQVGPKLGFFSAAGGSAKPCAGSVDALVAVRLKGRTDSRLRKNCFENY